MPPRYSKVEDNGIDHRSIVPEIRVVEALAWCSDYIPYHGSVFSFARDDQRLKMPHFSYLSQLGLWQILFEVVR